MLGIKIKLYSSKHFIQNNPVKNNLQHLFLQEIPAKDGLLPFKFFKLSYRDTGYLPLLMRSCFPASAARGFCLIRYSILIGCFNKTFFSVKYTGKNFDTQANFFFPRILLQRKEQYLKTNSL